MVPLRATLVSRGVVYARSLRPGNGVEYRSELYTLLESENGSKGRFNETIVVKHECSIGAYEPVYIHQWLSGAQAAQPRAPQSSLSILQVLTLLSSASPEHAEHARVGACCVVRNTV